eukprot:EG_transcript_29171
MAHYGKDKCNGHWQYFHRTAQKNTHYQKSEWQIMSLSPNERQPVSFVGIHRAASSGVALLGSLFPHQLHLALSLTAVCARGIHHDLHHQSTPTDGPFLFDL